MNNQEGNKQWKNWIKKLLEIARLTVKEFTKCLMKGEIKGLLEKTKGHINEYYERCLGTRT